MKKTLVLGASLKSHRYSNLAIKSLADHDFKVEAIGLKEGDVSGIHVQTGYPKLEDIHTVTLYMNSERQKKYYEYILSLKPKRVVFNPGTANPELKEILDENNIHYELDCTLVMLSSKRY
ncbi:MAG: CoA-binding protein [Bacteroidota bacterium]